MPPALGGMDSYDFLHPILAQKMAPMSWLYAYATGKRPFVNTQIIHPTPPVHEPILTETMGPDGKMMPVIQHPSGSPTAWETKFKPMMQYLIADNVPAWTPWVGTSSKKYLDASEGKLDYKGRARTPMSVLMSEVGGIKIWDNNTKDQFQLATRLLKDLHTNVHVPAARRWILRASGKPRFSREAFKTGTAHQRLLLQAHDQYLMAQTYSRLTEWWDLTKKLGTDDRLDAKIRHRAEIIMLHWRAGQQDKGGLAGTTAMLRLFNKMMYTISEREGAVKLDIHRRADVEEEE